MIVKKKYYATDLQWAWHTKSRQIVSVLLPDQFFSNAKINLAFLDSHWRYSNKEDWKKKEKIISANSRIFHSHFSNLLCFGSSTRTFCGCDSRKNKQKTLKKCLKKWVLQQLCIYYLKQNLRSFKFFILKAFNKNQPYNILPSPLLLQLFLSSNLSPYQIGFFCAYFWLFLANFGWIKLRFDGKMWRMIHHMNNSRVIH